MTPTKRKYVVEALRFSVNGYTHIVRQLTSIDAGKNFYYCGVSKYFKNEVAARRYKKQMEERESEIDKQDIQD